MLNLCVSFMVLVSSIMRIIKNQPSNSTSCSDNALCLLVLVAGILYWGLQVTSSFSVWGCVLKGCFERGIFWRAKLIAFEGHWRLQSWTLIIIFVNLGFFSAFWDNYKYKNMDKITHILENAVRCKYFEAGVHFKNAIKNSYQDGLGPLHTQGWRPLTMAM